MFQHQQKVPMLKKTKLVAVLLRTSLKTAGSFNNYKINPVNNKNNNIKILKRSDSNYYFK